MGRFSGTMPVELRRAQPPRLPFGAPRAEHLWRRKSPNGGTNSSARVNCEDAVHCARGWRVPQTNCIVPALAVASRFASVRGRPQLQLAEQVLGKCQELQRNTRLARSF